MLVKFPHEETTRLGKLSRPWHGPYRVVAVNDPDVTVVKVYFPQENQIQVHCNRVRPCPVNFPVGFYWYGGSRKGPGHPPLWVDKLLQSKQQLETVSFEEPGEGNIQNHESDVASGDESHRETEGSEKMDSCSEAEVCVGPAAENRDEREELEAVGRPNRRRRLPKRFQNDFVVFKTSSSGRP